MGKGTLVKLLMQEDASLALSVSCTTRNPREGETDGKDYFFLAREEFLRRRDEGDFLEWDEHFGNFYGTPKSFVLEQLNEKSVILEIDVKGALHVKKALEGEESEPVLIMIAPPSDEELLARLASRGSESKEELLQRLERAKYELSQKEEYDYTLINDDLLKTKETLRGIIEKEKIKRRF